MGKTSLMMMATAGILFCSACGSQRQGNSSNDSMRKDSTRMDTTSSMHTMDTTKTRPDSSKTQLGTQINKLQ